MTAVRPVGATISEVDHHVQEVDEVALHYVTAGDLAEQHRVVAVALRGFGDPGTETTLADFGLEMLADVQHGGSWHLAFQREPRR